MSDGSSKPQYLVDGVSSVALSHGVLRVNLTQHIGGGKQEESVRLLIPYSALQPMLQSIADAANQLTSQQQRAADEAPQNAE